MRLGKKKDKNEFTPPSVIYGLPVKSSAKHDSAMRYTSGVIGNGFYGDQWIGMEKADPTFGVWYPIDGYKRTHTGILWQHYIRRTDGHGDDDVNYYMKPNMQDPYLSAYLRQRETFVITPPITTGIKPYIDPWPEHWPEESSINIEIDVPNEFKERFYPFLSSMPLPFANIINAYGPFVHDARDYELPIWRDYHDYVEIHPSEQIWWTTTLNTGFGLTDTYHLLLMSDASERFSDWIPVPLQGTFAIAFEVKPSKYRHRFVIEYLDDHNLVHRSIDGKKHFLKFGNENILEVQEPDGVDDFLDISFEDVYVQILPRFPFSKQATQDTLVKGFIVIKTKISRNGHLMLNVNSNRLSKNWGYVGLDNDKDYMHVKVQFDKIKCLQEGDGSLGNDDEDLYGFVAAFGSNRTYKLPQTTFVPVESVQGADKCLFWYSLNDTNDGSFNSIVNLGGGNERRFAESRLIVVHKTGTISLVADLNEDDGGYDNNITLPDVSLDLIGTDPIDAAQQDAHLGDDVDDLLKKYYPNYGAYVEEIKVSSLPLNRAISKIAKFGSGGTEVEVHFTVTRIK